MGRLVGAVWGTILYFCMATVLALMIGVAALWISGKLNQQKLAQMVAVAHGVDLFERRDDENAFQPDGTPIEEQSAQRGLKLRQMELRAQFIYQEEQALVHLQTQVESNQALATKVHKNFEEQIQKWRTGNRAEGLENARVLVENLKPKQAKDQLMIMIENGEIDAVVRLMVAMPISKRAKIAGEFKTPEEEQELASILDLIREGQPDAGRVDQIVKER